MEKSQTQRPVMQILFLKNPDIFTQRLSSFMYIMTDWVSDQMWYGMASKK